MLVFIESFVFSDRRYFDIFLFYTLPIGTFVVFAKNYNFVALLLVCAVDDIVGDKLKGSWSVDQKHTCMSLTPCHHGLLIGLGVRTCAKFPHHMCSNKCT